MSQSMAEQARFEQWGLLDGEIGEGEERSMSFEEKEQYLKDIEEFNKSRRPRVGALTLEKLPGDVLQLIVDELSIIGDLTALMRTHSSFLGIVGKAIWRHFDIVWPQANSATYESNQAVDALTYGLGSLVKSKRLYKDKAKKRGNNYAEYVKKFSIGNGPPEDVEAYLPNTEGGKMLASLVGMAITFMDNLEVFRWNMPSGVLVEVWEGLASLGDVDDPEDCKLTTVHVRWHDNSRLPGIHAPPRPKTPTMNNFPEAVNASAEVAAEHARDFNRVERPSFSIVPPIKSLSVLDVDELAYFDEMSILIGKSASRLKVLRLGIASHALGADWTGPWHSTDLSQGSEARKKYTHYSRRLGGPLGVLVAHTCDFKNDEPRKPLDGEGQVKGNVKPPVRLRLEVLELERVPLVTKWFTKAIDVTKLTDITILDCPGHEKLWTTLRKIYAPKKQVDPYACVNAKKLKESTLEEFAGYCLSIRKVRVNCVSKELLSFIKHTLKPNSLEALFLQQGKHYDSNVSFDSLVPIIKRHHTSLKVLLLNSRSTDCLPGIGERTTNQWRSDRSFISYLTTGKMPNLRELSMAVEARDWHHLLQGLRYMPKLIALHIPDILRDGRPHHCDIKELGLQVLDVAALCPDVRLVYFAIRNRCYEIIETTSDDDSDHEVHSLHSDEENDSGEEEDDDDDDDVAVTSGTDGSDDENDDNDDSDETDDTNTTDDYDDESEHNPDMLHLKMREILFYDDKVSIFEARHGRL